MKRKETKSKELLVKEIEILKEEHSKLLIENKILKKANEILKKEIGNDYSLLTNKEKTLVIIALSNECKLRVLLENLKLKKSTYFYECKVMKINKYEETKQLITKIFYENYMCYGYRRLKKLYKMIMEYAFLKKLFYV